MRTTVDVPEHLLVEAKKLAAERHLSFTRIVEESLRAYLAEQRSRPSAKRLPPLPVLGDPEPLVALDDTSALLEVE
jgi:hypothetical protein